ncbi:MAG TPA: hypothetical protein VFC90_00200 [Planctomycetota bacterium]|nr:hypothetical protein [Planctomycetota bacterium]
MKTILTSLAILLASAVGAGLSSCVVHGHGHGHGGVAVTVPAVHVHDSYCGHYYYGDRWYHYSGHRHGHGCGHVYIGGRWTVQIN